MIFFAYIGFDSVSTHAEEAKNPKRDIPLAVIISLAVQGLLAYFFEYFAAGFAVGPSTITNGRLPTPLKYMTTGAATQATMPGTAAGW